MDMPFRKIALASLVSSAMLLAACGSEDRTVGQKVDHAVAESRDAAGDAKREMAEAGEAIQRGAERAGEAVKETLSDAGQVVADAAITTAVKAELINDERIDALEIDVDTKDGEVTLSGTAPDDAARDQAERLAESVEGVKEVHNKLVLASK
ncbi:MAG: BON domain-containing protein [Zoogloeaceae bacterium]|nr:BON domain-containing protein [Rhodocyclaceae bacterium]MCP5236925.1 BON domain-containing protein [Zoogloeaceae bacterium]